MPYHQWGDEDFDWEALNEAMDYIGRFCGRWARLVVLMKEKYGTIRYEFIYLWDWSRFKWVRSYQEWVFQKSIERACRKWPHIEDEIKEDCWLYEDEYWTTIGDDDD